VDERLPTNPIKFKLFDSGYNVGESAKRNPIKSKAKSPIYNPLKHPEGMGDNPNSRAVISLYDYFNYLGKAMEFISQISGNIQGTDLVKYKA
jgi:hypothetical protein